MDGETDFSRPSGVKVADILRDNLRRALDQFFADNADALDQIAKDGGHAAANGLLGDVGTLSGLISDLVLVLAITQPELGVPLEAVKAAEDAGGRWAIGSALGYMMGYTAFQMLNPIFLPLQHAIGDAAQTEIFDPQTAATLQAKGIINDAYGRSEAAGGNLSGDHYDKLVASAVNRPAVAELLALFNRGAMSEPEVMAQLQLLGYTPDAAARLFKLQRNLLGPADLALALLRTDITRDQMLEYAKLVGTTPDDMDILIGNTGEPPGAEELMFALRRGFITPDEFDHGLRQSRLRNEWIPTMTKLRYSPMSLADATRAVVENYLTPEEGGVIAQQNGLEPDHWPIVHESWGRPLAHEQMADLVFRGKASRSQFDQAMRESDIKNKYIDLSFEIATRLISPYELIRAMQAGVVGMQQGAGLLLQQGYSTESVSVMLKLGLHSPTTASHELTKTQIVALYEDGIVSRADTLAHLVALGLKEVDAEHLLQIADIATHAKEVRAEVAVVRLQYLQGNIDANKAKDQLRDIGQAPTQSDYSIALWDKEKARAAKSLTEAQVLKAAKQLTITFETATDMLVAMGYSLNNAQLLLTSDGVLPTRPAA